MRNNWHALLLMCWIAVPPVQAAEIVPPDVLAKTVTDEVLTILRADPEIRSGNARKGAQLIETRILPHLDFSRMTRLALGKNWARATPEQRQALTNEFRTLLVRVYAASLTLYRDQTIEYRPLKLAPTDTDVVVKSAVRRPGGDPVSVDYTMEKTESGWKVYDVKIEGISLVGNYRSTFSAEIERGGGIDGLIKALAVKNKGLAEKDHATAQF